MDLNIYKVDLDTDQPNGGKGESPRSAFTKYNNSLDTINSELTALGENVDTINDELTALGENVDTINDELTTLDDSAMKKADNLSGLTDKETARSNLGLSTAATKEVTTSVTDATPGRVLKVDDFGIGRVGLRLADFADVYIPNGLYTWDVASTNRPSNITEHYGTAIVTGRVGGSDSNHRGRILIGLNSDKIWFQRSVNESPWTNPVEIYHTGNTTVDGNGFIKRASPIIKLFSDSIEKTEHLEIAEAELERLGVGHYVLKKVPLLSIGGWYIETPKDRNGNIYFYLDYEEEEGGTLTIKTYEPDYSSGRAEAGAPVDILEGRFISLRFAEDPSLYPAPEMQEDTPEETEEIEPAI